MTRIRECRFWLQLCACILAISLPVIRALASNKNCVNGYGGGAPTNVIAFRPKPDLKSEDELIRKRTQAMHALAGILQSFDVERDGQHKLGVYYKVWTYTESLYRTLPAKPLTVSREAADELGAALERVRSFAADPAFRARLQKYHLRFGPEVLYESRRPLPNTFESSIKDVDLYIRAHQLAKELVRSNGGGLKSKLPFLINVVDFLSSWAHEANAFVGPDYENSRIFLTAQAISETFLAEDGFMRTVRRIARSSWRKKYRIAAQGYLNRVERLRVSIHFLENDARLTAVDVSAVHVEK